MGRTINLDILLGLCLCLTLACFVEGRIEDVELSFTPYSGENSILLSDPFGADVGATLQVDLSLQVMNDQISEYVYLVLYTDAQYKDVMYYSYSACNYPSQFRYEFQGNKNITYHIQDKDLYYLYLLNCDSRTPESAVFVLSGRVWWLNPNHSELSLEEQPLYSLSYLFLPASATINVLWFMVYYFNYKYSIFLHTLLSISIKFNTVALGLLWFYFWFYQSTGYQNIYIDHVKDIMTVVADTTLLTVLLLVGLGWFISRTRLNVKNKQLLWGSMFLYAGFEFAYLLCLFPENLCSVYMVFFQVIRFLITFAIVIAMNGESELLRSSVRMEDPVDRAVTSRKIHMYTRFKYLLLVVLLVPILIVLLEFPILSWEEHWVSTSASQFLYLCTFVIVSYSLRPRRRTHNVYIMNSLLLEDGEEEVVVLHREEEEEEQAESDEEDDLLEARMQPGGRVYSSAQEAEESPDEIQIVRVSNNSLMGY